MSIDMHPGVEYLRSKRMSFIAISVAQLTFGMLCVLLWTASIEFCLNCFDEDGKSWPHRCEWTSPLQGVWGGAFAIVCAIIGIVQACSTSIAGNSKHFVACVLSLLAASGMVSMEILLLKDKVFYQSSKEFIDECLPPPTNSIWEYFHYTVIGMGGICIILGFSGFIMTSYAQVGCFGTYCDTEADYEYLRSRDNTYEERYRSRQADGVREQCTVRHTCTCSSDRSQQREQPQTVQERHQRPVTIEEEPRPSVTADEILRLDEGSNEENNQNLIQLADDNEVQVNPNEGSQNERIVQRHNIGATISPPPPYSLL